MLFQLYAGQTSCKGQIIIREVDKSMAEGYEYLYDGIVSPFDKYEPLTVKKYYVENSSFEGYSGTKLSERNYQLTLVSETQRKALKSINSVKFYNK